MKALVIFTAKTDNSIRNLSIVYKIVKYNDIYVAWCDFKNIFEARVFLAEDVLYSLEFYQVNRDKILNGIMDDFHYNGVTIAIKKLDDRNKWLELAKNMT
jgi:hypothetical protein